MGALLIILIFIAIVVEIVSIIWAASMASSKGYSVWIGIGLAFFFGLLGVLIMALLSDRVQPVPLGPQAYRSRTSDPAPAERIARRRTDSPTDRFLNGPPRPQENPSARGGAFRGKEAKPALDTQALDALERLAALHEKSALTDEEFAAQKAKLLE